MSSATTTNNMSSATNTHSHSARNGHVAPSRSRQAQNARNGQMKYVAPFYNPFLRINIRRNQNHKDDKTQSKQDYVVQNDEKQKVDDVQNDNNHNQQNRVFPLSHYQQNR
eukprot:162065_1